MAEEGGGAERGAQEAQEGRNECRNARRHPGGKGKLGEVRGADTGAARSVWEPRRGPDYG
jgi:hypothetical protein